jgi:hypothetical protein
LLWPVAQPHLSKPPEGNLQKGKGSTDQTSSSAVHLQKTKSLESSKRKRKSSEAVSEVKLQVASSLAQLSRKKIKKPVKKVAVAEVRCVPSAFDDDITAEPSRKGFFSCLWPDLRFDVRRRYTPGSENEFMDVETFSDDVAEVQKEVTAPVAVVVIEVADPQPSGPQDEA